MPRKTKDATKIRNAHPGLEALECNSAQKRKGMPQWNKCTLQGPGMLRDVCHAQAGFKVLAMLTRQNRHQRGGSIPCRNYGGAKFGTSVLAKQQLVNDRRSTDVNEEEVYLAGTRGVA